MDDGVTNSAWDAYDTAIQTEVNAYNVKFQATAQTTGYKPVDWKLCKAMLWVESGGPASSAWTGRVMQIGNSGDPAIGVLRRGGEGSSSIMSIQLAADVKTDKIDTPTINLRAGIAYLFTRMAQWQEQSVNDPKDPTVRAHTVVPGDTLDGIAKREGTTVAVLTSMNSLNGPTIHSKQVLKFRKASIQRVISGWRDFTTGNIASRYNVGDLDYSAKLDYVLDLFKKLNRQP